MHGSGKDARHGWFGGVLSARERYVVRWVMGLVGEYGDEGKAVCRVIFLGGTAFGKTRYMYVRNTLRLQREILSGVGGMSRVSVRNGVVSRKQTDEIEGTIDVCIISIFTCICTHINV